jgi:hypothetical protein
MANVSGSAVRDRDVNRGYPRVSRPSDHRERLWDRRSEIAHRAATRTAVSAVRPPAPSTIDRPATSLGSRCAIAMSTATTRVLVDHSDRRPSRTSLGPREKNRGAPSAIFFQKAESDLD